MVDAKPVTIREVYFEKCKAILKLKFSRKDKSSPKYQYWASSLENVGVPPLLEDPFESKFVFAGTSNIGDNAGDGLFLKKDVKANTTISFYNGIRVKPGETAPFANYGYQIFVDWNRKSTVSFLNTLISFKNSEYYPHLTEFFVNRKSLRISWIFPRNIFP